MSREHLPSEHLPSEHLPSERLPKMMSAQAYAVQMIQKEIEASALQGKFSASFLGDFSSYRFTAEDQANDCAHPSLAGHEHIAQHLYPGLRGLLGGR